MTADDQSASIETWMGVTRQQGRRGPKKTGYRFSCCPPTKARLADGERRRSELLSKLAVLVSDGRTDALSTC